MFNPELGKTLIITGIVIVFIGVALMLFDKIPFMGKLPGDIRIHKENFSFYLPVTTSILISIILSLIFWLVSKK